MKPPIVIVGVGALGSHLGLLLRNWAYPTGLYPIRVCDFDRVEKKNVMSQFHTTMGVGRNKAQAFQQALHGMFASRVEAFPHKLTLDNVTTLLGGAALVIDCTDNAEARRVIQGFVKPMKIPCLHGCLGADGTIGRVVWTDQFKPDEAGEGQATCENGEHLPFIGMVSSYLAQAAQRFLKTGERWAFQVLPDKVIRL